MDIVYVYDDDFARRQRKEKIKFIRAHEEEARIRHAELKRQDEERELEKRIAAGFFKNETKSNEVDLYSETESEYEGVFDME